MLCPDGGVCVEVAGPGSSVEVVVTIGLLDRGCDTAVEEAVDDFGVIGVGVSVKIIIENTFMHIDIILHVWMPNIQTGKNNIYFLRKQIQTIVGKGWK